jgi:hypothetical protein
LLEVFPDKSAEMGGSVDHSLVAEEKWASDFPGFVFGFIILLN